MAALSLFLAMPARYLRNDIRKGCAAFSAPIRCVSDGFVMKKKEHNPSGKSHGDPNKALSDALYKFYETLSLSVR